MKLTVSACLVLPTLVLALAHEHGLDQIPLDYVKFPAYPYQPVMIPGDNEGDISHYWL